MSDDGVSILLSTHTLKLVLARQNQINPDFEVETPEGSIPLILFLSNKSNGYEFIKANVHCQNAKYNVLQSKLTFALSYVFDQEDNTDIHWNSSIDKTSPGSKWFNLCYYQNHNNILIKCEVYYKAYPYTKRMVEMNNQLLETNKQLLETNKQLLKCTKMNEQLMKSGKCSDFTIHTGVESFPCHKAILATRSAVFDRKLTSDMKEGTENQVTIDDIAPETVGDMLSFMYTNSVENISQKATSLVPVAEKYGLTDLKEECSKFLMSSISLDTATELALLADMYTLEHLREASLRFIANNRRQLQEIDPDWLEPFKKSLSLLMEIIKLSP